MIAVFISWQSTDMSELWFLLHVCVPSLCLLKYFTFLYHVNIALNKTKTANKFLSNAVVHHAVLFISFRRILTTACFNCYYTQCLGLILLIDISTIQILHKTLQTSYRQTLLEPLSTGQFCSILHQCKKNCIFYFYCWKILSLCRTKTSQAEE